MAAEDGGYRRVVIEKPFGTDLESARALNATVHSAFQESQIYRIDHYYCIVVAYLECRSKTRCTKVS